MDGARDRGEHLEHLMNRTHLTLLVSLPLLGCSDYEIHSSQDSERPGAEATVPVDTGEPLVEEPPAEVLTGDLNGQICDPSGEGHVAGAHVYVDLDDGSRIEAWTDGEGRFVLEGLPVGRHEVHVEKGSFQTVFVVEMAAGEVWLSEEECLDPDLSIAVLAGSYDLIEELLDEHGLTHDLYPNQGTAQADLLRDATRLASYDIVFLDCGMSDDWRTWEDAVGANLRGYVQSGGSLYASDWAFYAIEAAFPGSIDFLGDDHFPEGAFGGDSGMVSAEVLDPNMVALLGTDQAQIHYNLAGWAIAEGVGSTSEVLLRGRVPTWTGAPISDAPLAVRFSEGGTVIFTTFHNEAQLTADMRVLLGEIILSL